jgi:hypothetical protein
VNTNKARRSRHAATRPDRLSPRPLGRLRDSLTGRFWQGASTDLTPCGYGCEQVATGPRCGFSGDLVPTKLPQAISQPCKCRGGFGLLHDFKNRGRRETILSLRRLD